MSAPAAMRLFSAAAQGENPITYRPLSRKSNKSKKKSKARIAHEPAHVVQQRSMTKEGVSKKDLMRALGKLRRKAGAGASRAVGKAAGPVDSVVDRARLARALRTKSWKGPHLLDEAIDKAGKGRQAARAKKLTSRKGIGDMAKNLGSKVDKVLAKRALNKGKTNKAIWHSEVKPVGRTAKVVAQDPGAFPLAGAVEATSQIKYPHVLMMHSPTVTTALAGGSVSRAIKGKPSPREVYRRIKAHKKMGIGGTKA